VSGSSGVRHTLQLEQASQPTSSRLVSSLASVFSEFLGPITPSATNNFDHHVNEELYITTAYLLFLYNIPTLFRNICFSTRIPA